MKKIISLSVFGILSIVLLIVFISVKNSAATYVSFGDGYAILRIFDTDGITDGEISTIRYAAEAASTATDGEKGRLWCDAYSYFTDADITSSTKSIACKVVVTAGDFFLFHDFRFVDGWYYTDTDLHPDRVVIDERLAFAVYGSNDVEGMPLEINATTYYIAGVVATDESDAKTLQFEDMPFVYIPSYIAEELYGTRSYESYEIMLQNPVKNYAVTALREATEGKTVIDVTNRFGVLNILKLVKAFPSRSYRTDGAVYPYWENNDRGAEDILALLLPILAVTLLAFTVNLFIVLRIKYKLIKAFIKERKRP